MVETIKFLNAKQIFESIDETLSTLKIECMWQLLLWEKKA